MLTTELDYDLPVELIAQKPVEPRDTSRLMVIDRARRSFSHRRFCDLPNILSGADVLIANDSQVIPARLTGFKPTGGKVELLLLRKLDAVTWRALVGGRRVKRVDLPVAPGRDIHAVVKLNPGEADWLVRFDEPIDPYLDRIGQMPLPPYIHVTLQDRSRYQTVYARMAGSAAAPTAGLHFTPELIETLGRKGTGMGFVTLHVGLDTFKPISEEVVESHLIHNEWCELPEETAQLVNQTRARSGLLVAVGTTSVRVLETAAQQGPAGACRPYAGFTQLYITPGYPFRLVDAMITNFHLPRSTLLAMVSAFMGLDLMRAAYTEAIRERYRFYSFGDAMLIL